VARWIDQSGVEPQHNNIKVNGFYTIQTIVWWRITPEEAKAGSIRTVASVEDEADYSVEKYAIEGIRLQAVENINKYQAETIKWRDRKVRLKNIKPGHLVLRRVANPDTVGKLQLKWEGPFLVVSSSRLGSYRLKDMDDNDIPRSWNADELRRYYV
jgi:hypothetical protein